MSKIILYANKALYCHKKNGYILLEALIVAALLTAGILTMARVQTNGLSLGHSSMLRSKATILAHQMADRIRANRSGYLEGAYNAQGGADCKTDGCKLAKNDYAEWAADLKSQLPSGEGAVCLTSTPDIGSSPMNPGCNSQGNILAIKIWWIHKSEKKIDNQPKAFFYTVLRP